MLILIQGQSLLGNKTKQCSVDCLLKPVFEYKQISRAMADLSSLNSADKELKSSEKSVEPNIDNVENLNPQLSNIQTETSSQCATAVEVSNNPHQQTNSSGESLTTTTKTSEETIEASRAGQKRPHCGRRHRNHRHHHHEHSKYCHHHQQQKNQGAEKMTESSSKQSHNDDDHHRHHQHHHHAHRHHHHHHHHHHDTKRHVDSVSEIELATASITRSSTIDLYDATDSELNVLSLESSQLCHKHQQKRQQLLLLKQQQETNEQAYSSAKSNDMNKTKDTERHHHNQGTCNRRSHHQHRHQNDYLDHDIEPNQIEIINKEQDDIVIKPTELSQTLGKVSSNEIPRKLQVVSSSSSATVASANTVIAKLDTNSAMFDSAFDTTNQTDSKMNKRSPLQSISSNACTRKQHRRHHHLHNNNSNKQEPQDSNDPVNESEQKSGDDRCSRHQNRKDHSHHRRRSKSSQIAHQEEGYEVTKKESSEDPNDARKHHHHGHHHHTHRSGHHGHHHHHHHHHHRHHGHHHHSTNKQFKSDHAKSKQRLSDGDQKPVVNDESLKSSEQSVGAMKEVDEEKEGLVEMDGIQLSTLDIDHRGNLEKDDAETVRSADVGDKKSIDQHTVEKPLGIDTIEMELFNVKDATGIDNSIRKHQSKEVKISKNDKSFFGEARDQIDAEVNVNDSKKNSTLVNATIDKPAENLQVLNESGEIKNNNSGKDIKEVVQNESNEHDKNLDQSAECPSSSSHRNQSSQDDKQVTCDINAARVPSDRRCRLCWCWCCPCSR